MKIFLLTRNRPFQIYLINKLMEKKLLSGVIQEITETEKINFSLENKYKISKYYRELKKIIKEPIFYFKKRKVFTDLYGNKEKMHKLVLKKDYDNVQDKNLEILQVDSLNNEKTYEYLKQKKPDIILIFGTGIVKQKILKLAIICSLNLHFGISPYYRGGDTILWPCVKNDFQHLGVTIHEPIDKPDAGPIVFTKNIKIDEYDNIYSLSLKSTIAGADLFIKTIELIKNNNYKSFPQDLSIGKQYYGKDTYEQFNKVWFFYKKWKKGLFKNVYK